MRMNNTLMIFNNEIYPPNNYFYQQIMNVTKHDYYFHRNEQVYVRVRRQLSNLSDEYKNSLRYNEALLD